jgi:hypothetical protein
VDARRADARRLVIARLRTARNRELVNLLLVALLTMAGFSAVYIARENAVSSTSLTYAGFFLSLYLIAHLVLRVALPEADPYLLPLVALLTALGEIEIYRIEPELARDQSVWIVAGVALFTAVIWFARDVRVLENLRYTCGALTVLLLVATMLFGTEVLGAKLWIAWRATRSSRASSRRCCS